MSCTQPTHSFIHLFSSLFTSFLSHFTNYFIFTSFFLTFFSAKFANGGAVDYLLAAIQKHEKIAQFVGKENGKYGWMFHFFCVTHTQIQTSLSFTQTQTQTHRLPLSPSLSHSPLPPSLTHTPSLYFTATTILLLPLPQVSLYEL